MNQESTSVNYSLALKNYSQNGRGRSRRKFCEDEGYDYNKFMLYARKGQKELSVLKDSDSMQSVSSFIPLVVESTHSDAFGIAEVRVRFTYGMELIQRDVDVNELFSIVNIWQNMLVRLSYANRGFGEQQCEDKIHRLKTDKYLNISKIGIIQKCCTFPNKLIANVLEILCL